jgi:hypothetical protein
MDDRGDDPDDSWLAALVRTPLKASRTIPAEAALISISFMVTTLVGDDKPGTTINRWI